ncbi:hypothetical protein [Thysanoplusia orichalcea nucleopolyhedrovirus]|uniref:Uncharacterized protein n=1 Tax=Thysanoplusia orichalcea nucleopolyhedrovirus TaxID=101850 RepID=L0CM45_9ABAC|nr:hypothetical protein [Thysanoplusia orichalcea nucleopolyhedrovirus]AGA16301.1 hypothetical protein [Thysanoplusia orichalcea nucleopolyhedrovirus]
MDSSKCIKLEIKYDIPLHDNDTDTNITDSTNINVDPNKTFVINHECGEQTAQVNDTFTDNTLKYNSCIIKM